MDTLEQVRALIVDHLGAKPEEITPEMRLEGELPDTLGADSLDMVELTMAVEDHFKIEIADDDAEQVKTVADLVALIDRVRS